MYSQFSYPTSPWALRGCRLVHPWMVGLGPELLILNQPISTCFRDESSTWASGTGCCLRCPTDKDDRAARPCSCFSDDDLPGLQFVPVPHLVCPPCESTQLWTPRDLPKWRVSESSSSSPCQTKVLRLAIEIFTDHLEDSLQAIPLRSRRLLLLRLFLEVDGCK